MSENIQIMNQHNYCVIMAGGANTDFSLLGATFDRFSKIIPKENILVVTLDNLGEKARAALPEISKNNLLLEPYRRHTAPCITFATYLILKRDPEATAVVTPCDHVILDEDIFLNTVLFGLDYVASSNALLTLGVIPDRAETSFGYIQAVGGRKAIKGKEPVKVKTFTEKPDKDLAQVLYTSGEFLWNTGIFFWKAQTIREELEDLCPEITSLFSGWQDALDTDKQALFLEKAYAGAPKISIDYGVMEKTSRAMLFPAKFRWADVGDKNKNEKTSIEIRRDVEVRGSYDVIVAGAGPSGVAAAIAAARQGAKVAVVERYGFIENNTDLENVGVRIYLNSAVQDVYKEGNAVRGVVIATNDGPIALMGKVTIDATGDGVLALLADAEIEDVRRVMGGYILTADEIEGGCRFDNVVVRGEKDGKTYDIPYTCFVPIGIDNLYIAGKCISGTQRAKGMYGNAETCASMGLSIGTAAAICARTGVTPRQLNVTMLQENLAANGIKLF
ncbi:MAG: FAD-dependent oxidoreductase [Bacteroidales bacterium]|nr:FAD-dependent oxidoreductase [Bacteroidales bacterium]